MKVETKDVEYICQTKLVEHPDGLPIHVSLFYTRTYSRITLDSGLRKVFVSFSYSAVRS